MAAEHSAWGRLGAHTTHALHDSSAITAPARRAFLGKFEREVDPAGVLEPAERAKRAEHARKLHMQRLAAKSAAVRRQRRAS